MAKNVNVIMIFGAGINQVELIREAKKLKLISVVVDPMPDPPGKAEADFFYTVAGDDYKSTKAIAIKHAVDGIVTGQMEKPLRLMAKLADEMGFIFHSLEVTEKCLDKWLMKSALQAFSVPCAKGILLRAWDKINIEALKDFKFPLIVKPTDSYSSRGVYKSSSLFELESHIEETRQFSTRGDIIIEEFMDGEEYSVETITFKGDTNIIQITKKFITPYPQTVEMAHFQPANLTEVNLKAVSMVVKKGIKALGIENSAGHTEIIITEDGPKIVEIGARLGGDFISSYLTKSSTGVSMDKAAIQVALGIEPDLTPQHMKYSMIKYLELTPWQVVKDVLPIDDILNIPGVVFAWVYLKPGDLIKPITHSALRPACIIVEAHEKDTLLKLMDIGIKTLSNKFNLY